METYRISSRLKDKDREYLIQTTNDAARAAVSTTVYVDGVQGESESCAHPGEIGPQEILSLVKMAHGEKKKEIENLLAAYREVMDRGHPDQMYQLGTAFLYKCFFHEAAELFSAVTTLSPDHHQAFNNLGVARLALAQVDAAIKAAQSAVTLRPGFADYRNNLGEVYLAAEDFDAAQEEFEQAININMYYAEAYFNLGLTYIVRCLRENDRRQTSSNISRAASSLHKSTLIHTEYKNAPEYDEGIKALNSSDFGRALMLLKGIREARRERHRQEFSSFYMRFFLRPEWVNEKAVEDRINFLLGEIEKNPSYVDLQSELAQCYLEQARLCWQKSVERYKKALEMNPSLASVSAALEESEDLYARMNGAISRITEKG